MNDYIISWRTEALRDASELILFLCNVSAQAAIELKNQIFDLYLMLRILS